MLRLAPVLAVLLAACAPTAPSGPLRAATEPDAPLRLVLTAQAEVRRDTLFVAATVTNRSSRRAAFEFGACSVNVLGWRGTEPAGQPDIDSRGAGDPEESLGRMCILVAHLAQLAPGESTDAGRLQMPVRHLLGDDALDGPYALAAVFGYRADSPQLAGTRASYRELRSRLGVVSLDARRPPLGSEIVRGSTRYTIGDVQVDEGRLRATVTAREVPWRGSSFAGFDACAVTVLAFTRTVDRDQAPRAAPPAATHDAACEQPVPQPTIPSSESRREPLYGSVLGPVTATIDLRLSDLLNGQPPGRYALALAVRPLGGLSSRLTPLPRVYLSAGDVDWPGR